MCKLNKCLDTLKLYSTIINSRKFAFNDNAADDVTVKSSNRKNINTALTAPENTINIPKDMAIAYAGATGDFLQPGPTAINIQPTDNLISIIIPDGKRITSTHECEIDLPELPSEANKTHIVPGLAHTSLISIKMLRDAGCKVTYDEDAVKVYYKEKVVWKGQRKFDKTLGLTTQETNKTSKSTANST